MKKQLFTRLKSKYSKYSFTKMRSLISVIGANKFYTKPYNKLFLILNTFFCCENFVSIKVRAYNANREKSRSDLLFIFYLNLRDFRYCVINLWKKAGESIDYLIQFFLLEKMFFLLILKLTIKYACMLRRVLHKFIIKSFPSA